MTQSLLTTTKMLADAHVVARWLRPPDDLRTLERGTAKQAAAILGLKPRKLQAMSARGEIPGAAKLGRQWTYDLAKLRRFVEQREQTCQNEKPRRAAIGAAVSFGPKLWSAGGGSGGRLKRMIRESQQRASDRKSTRLNSSHLGISYAVFC